MQNLSHAYVHTHTHKSPRVTCIVKILIKIVNTKLPLAYSYVEEYFLHNYNYQCTIVYCIHSTCIIVEKMKLASTSSWYTSGCSLMEAMSAAVIPR